MGWGGCGKGGGEGNREILHGRVMDIFESNIDKMRPRIVCFQHCLQLNMLTNNRWTCLVCVTWY